MLRLLVLPVLMLGLLSAPSTAHAAEEFTLKVATVAPPNTPWEALLKEFKKSVEAKTGGRVKVKLYVGGTMGDENETVLKVKRGQLQAVGASTGAIATQVPELSVVELPFLFASFKEADTIIDTVVTPLLEPIMRDYGFVLGFWSENGFRHFGTRDKFVKAPGDLAGKKMRAQESGVHLEMYKNLGAAPVPVPTTEVLTALQNGTVDGFDQSLLFMLAASWHTTIKFVTLSSHIYQPACIIYNKAWFDSLPPDIQKILIDEGRALQDKSRAAVRALNKKLIKVLTDAGVQVYQLTDAERAAFAAKAKAGRDTFRKAVGKKGSAMLDAIEAAQKKK
jgi:tripartite ATP-independent transporter DctP family solute receptor